MGTVPPPAAGSPGVACQNRRPLPLYRQRKSLSAVGPNRWLSPFARRLPPESSHEGTQGAMSSLRGRLSRPASRPRAVAGTDFPADLQRSPFGEDPEKSGRQPTPYEGKFPDLLTFQLTNDGRNSFSTILTGCWPRSVRSAPHGYTNRRIWIFIRIPTAQKLVNRDEPP